MATVYVWLPDEDNVGHASLQLSNGKYISWWPAPMEGKAAESSKKHNVSLVTKKNAEYRPKTYQEDCELEGKKADLNIKIPKGKLDEEAIADWFDKEVGSGYNLLTSNCSTKVYEALVVGGAKVDSGFNYPRLGVWTPAKVGEFAQAVARS